MSHRIDLGLNAVIVAVTDEVPRILTVRRPDRRRVEGSFAPQRLAAAESARRSEEAIESTTRGPLPAGPTIEDALPFGPLDPETDPTLERGLRRWVHEQTGLELGYVEQLYTFGDRLRDPVEAKTGGRSVSVAYLALVRERPGRGSGEARWGDVYGFLPWEDWREGRPEIFDRLIEPGIEHWIENAADTLHRNERRERADIAFGFSGVAWDGERVLERYELLYEAHLIEEARRSDETDPTEPAVPGAPEPAWSGQIAALDHRRILASALGRLRGKLKYRPVVFELLPPRFTLFQLQRVVEALAGVRLHKQNFRRLVESGGLVEGTGRQTEKTGGRPAELFVFRREVLRERPAPGVGLPGVRR
ncbi:MAG: hypothetical protein ABJC13_25185 [Acidobacteriota bacterium]